MITDAEKQTFLQHIRDGHDRPTAARMTNPTYTGHMFRRITLERNHKYDPVFARAYVEACGARGPIERDYSVAPAHLKPSPFKSNGILKAMHIPDDQLDLFLEEVRKGVPSDDAVKVIQPPTSLHQVFNRSKNDVEFGRKLAEAREIGHDSYKDRLRAKAATMALLESHYPALRDQMIMYVEEAKVLSTSRHEIGGMDGQAIRLLAEKYLPNLPPEVLKQLIEDEEKKALGGSG